MCEMWRFYASLQANLWVKRHHVPYSPPVCEETVEGDRRMDWKTLLAYITGTVDQELLLRNEYLVTENRALSLGTVFLQNSGGQFRTYDCRESHGGGVFPNASTRGSPPWCVARWHRGWAMPRRLWAGAGARFLRAPRRAAGAVKRSTNRAAASSRPWRVRHRVAPATTRAAPSLSAGALRLRRCGRCGPPPTHSRRPNHRHVRPPALRWECAGRRWSRGVPSSWPKVGCRVVLPWAAGWPRPLRVPGGLWPCWIRPVRPW